MNKKNRKIIYFVIGFVLLLLLVGGGYLIYVNKYKNTSTTQTSSSLLINIQGSSFSPAVTTIKKGSTVVWENNDSYAHHVAFDNGATDLGYQPAGVKVQFTFNKVGTYKYHCTIHSSMKGTIIVK